MDSFFNGLAPEDAIEIESLSRLMYDLRCNRDKVLEQWQVPDVGSLLARIEAGEVAEHPAYEHYLSARILDETRQSIREALARNLKEVGR
ncbi:hypothetical protein G3580_16710 [Nitrogeniibacter mangrovi]|uniref:Uncharacterized protein n=1 Tax=Nitrogeniibacter mangrovi TaxID=2016596 RepID=A0A6C1BA25_9RHOO|nr:hypothetical protein [Nitrogeniibacter mangrovi]QID19114.1 hypothetical protein G3580_16710 [Nitrogeniibacter mangrovi]